MLIGEFARRAGLSQDTVRFYVRKGLLAPQSGAGEAAIPIRYSASGMCPQR